ncbi:uncharacterized protein LOC133918674 [Phragmites australis]|uniref:uncharacterized protein LOC133918674 n=1 Tax=Phragmites australis TaxID=29695 RepID=UPI002D7873EF|nr:uncharacterized protein LOC133918674 [Phragmites australis]
MPMERSVSCAQRSTTYGREAAADLRCYSASYAPRVPSNKVKRARSTSSWSRPAPGAVQRSGSVKSIAAPGLNLRSYSASYTASYGPTADGAGAGAGGQLKRSGSITNWSSASRRSVNLRGYTPSFSALDRTATVAPAPAKKASDDAELQRKKRLVVYKVYGVEGKVRDSVRRGVSWIKSKCSRVVYGWW